MLSNNISEKSVLKGKICHLLHDDGPGGGPTTVIKHINYYRKIYHVTFISGGRGRVHEFCKKENIPAYSLPINRIWKCLWGWIPLYYRLQKLRPDVLIVHGQWAAPLGALIGRLAGIKKILFISHWPSFYTDWDLYRVVRNHIVEAIPVAFCDKVVCISPGNLYQYQIRFPDHLDKLIHISNPYDISSLPTQEEAIATRHRLGWRDNLVHVVSVGRIATQKHLEWLLQSWVIVQKQVPEARLWIVGDGEESERMRALALKLKITDTCTFLGAQKNGIEFINASDLVAMSSLYEGHANIPMEAHACGKAIVANAVDGIRLSISDGVDGFLVPAADIDGFSEKLIRLCRSQELREEFGRAGLKNLKRFSLDKVMVKYSNLIQEFMDN